MYVHQLTLKSPSLTTNADSEEESPNQGLLI